MDEVVAYAAVRAVFPMFALFLVMSAPILFIRDIWTHNEDPQVLQPVTRLAFVHVLPEGIEVHHQACACPVVTRLIGVKAHTGCLQVVLCR